MIKWEYLSMQFERADIKRFRDNLNEFGEIGWELVSLTPIDTKGVNFYGGGSETSDLVAVFKRPNE